MSKSKSNLLNELVEKQLKNVYYANKLTYRDLNRLTKYIDHSIFTDKCCIWNGYISETGVDNKNYYINFFFKDKKVSLHRLLYTNFVGVINANEYIRVVCKNKGKCCCINHFVKFTITNDDNIDEGESEEDETTEEEQEIINDNGDNSDNSDIETTESDDDFIVKF